jgi:hypothetical protein
MDKIFTRADPQENQQKVSLFRPISPLKMGEAPRGDYGRRMRSNQIGLKLRKSRVFSCDRIQ